jgi:tRNA nucleotidyltransferase/poly(A) polymerase
MADYIYLLENRLSVPQRNALRVVREIAKTKGVTVFLVGGAVRDLTSGSPVRDLDVVVQGNALKLKKDIEKAGGVITGELEAGQSLFVRFPGSVRMEFGSTLSVTYPKPGKPVMKPATILDDLRRRDFTANAMAISLNEGSYGLLMDPLNGVADIENRELRLVSNYGFIEDPVRLIRAARLMARLGWTMDEKTQGRYQTAVEEEYIKVLNDFHRGYETEEIVHEEDPLRVLKRLEAEGWMKHLAPFWTAAKVNEAELEKLRDVQTQLQMQGIQPDPAAAHFVLLTAKLAPKEAAALKAGFPRQGFVRDIEALEAEAKEFAAQLGGKGAAAASDAWKLITSAKPEAVLWTGYSSKSGAVQVKLKSFYTEWPQVRNKIPYVTMQEMRITPELPGYDELLDKLFFELMDGRLQTQEEIKAFLEPYSPPAPPPPVNTRRPRAAKKEAKGAKGRAKKAAVVESEEDELDIEVADELAAAVTVPDEESDEPDEREDTEAPEPPDAEDIEPGDAEDDAGDEAEEDEEPVAAARPAVKAARPMAESAAAAQPPPVKPVARKADPVPAATKAAVPEKAANQVSPAKAVGKVQPAKATAPAATPAAKKAVTAKAASTKAGPAKSPPVKSVPSKSLTGKTVPTKAAPAKKAVPVVIAKKAVPAGKASAKKTAPPLKTKSVAKPAGRHK